MKTNSIPFKLLCFSFLLFVLFSCTTDDVLPTLIEVSSSETNLNESNGVITVSAKLNASATNHITIPLTISGSATLDVDYKVSAPQITINSGLSSGEITITGIQDNNIEGIETIDILIGAIENVNTISPYEIRITILDENADSDSDGVPDAEDDCPLIPGKIENKGCPYLGFLINEVLYDPGSGDAGDANADGTRDALDDEFIEFFNSGPELDLSGYTISDESKVRHIFPAGTIIPLNGVLVLFGGGMPTGSFGGAIIQTASEGSLNISNAGDIITLRDPSDNTVLTFDVYPLSGNPNESYTRNPDLTGDFVQHAGIDEANGALFSPGTKLDGSSF